MTTTMVKNSEWVEKLPNGWVFLPVRAVLRERKEKNTELKESNILSVMKGVGVIRYEDKGNVGNKSSERPEAYKIVRKNDLVLNSMNLSIGSVGMANEDGVTSSVYIIYQARPEIADPGFYNYLFQTTSFQRHLASYGRGIMELREAVKERDIKNQPVVVPPLGIQKRIASFLDEKTKIIDDLIEKKGKLIELLREKRAALITRAVTKGLPARRSLGAGGNSNAKLKPSGIDWLGDIPEGWEIKKIKHVSEIVLGKMLDSKETAEMHERRYLRAQNVQWGRVDIADVKTMWFSIREMNVLKLKKGDLLVCEGGEVGRTSIWNNELDECYFQNSINRVRVRGNSRFFLYAFEAAGRSGFFDQIVNRVSIAHLTREKLKEVVFPIPPTEGQEQIADFLDAKTAKIDKAVSLIESQIEKLKEYRSSLIYHAVTGKIKI